MSISIDVYRVPIGSYCFDGICSVFNFNGSLSFQGVSRGRVMWKIVYAIYVSLPAFQQAHLYEMGFTELLSVFPFYIDVALMQALKEHWDGSCNAFIMPWGHIIPNLKDVARITGLRVHGNPVTGTTRSDFRAQARRLLGYEDGGLGLLRTLRDQCSLTC